jgi:hypothetical protein
MSAALFPRYDVEVLLTLSPQELDTQFGDMALLIGPNLADQVDTAVQEHGLGYYPALDYFSHANGIDPQLLAAAKHIYAMVAQVVHRTVRADLRELVRGVEVATVQTVAETLPHIRPGRADSLHQLARHYAPMSVRVRFSGSLRQDPEVGVSPEQHLARETAHTLKQHFAAVEVLRVANR